MATKVLNSKKIFSLVIFFLILMNSTMINDFPAHIPNNFKFLTHHFLPGVIDFTVDALNLKTGKAIKILSYLKVAKAFGVDNY
jgi:hypothetical protein